MYMQGISVRERGDRRGRRERRVREGIKRETEKERRESVRE